LFTFSLSYRDPSGKARAGLIETAHGGVQTPMFMPVGTAGSVKAVHQHELDEVVKAQIILGNTYHLYLRPGLEVLENAGGLHRFMGWNKPILTDSGGFQVYSLSHRRKIDERGVVFQSHIDGSSHTFTPENVMDIQRAIGADIIMAFDECPPYPCEYRYARESMELTHRWLRRCRARFDETAPRHGYEQTLFPIVQGSVYADLRRASAETVAAMNHPANAIGGMSVGEPADEMYPLVEVVCDILPPDKPRYLMGVGTPANILECIALGVDMFDCVLPTRNARHGLLYTAEGIINIKNQKWRDDHSPIDPEGPCELSRRHSKAYLRHLIHSKEILGAQIASLHNLCFFLWLAAEARRRIIQGDFTAWKNQLSPRLERKR
jgi:queuine tRNA-ribosyltransferase